jgi:hypothetical protein
MAGELTRWLQLGLGKLTRWLQLGLGELFGLEVFRLGSRLSDRVKEAQHGHGWMDGWLEGKGMDCAQAFLVFVLRKFYLRISSTLNSEAPCSNSSPVAIMGRAKSNHISKLAMFVSVQSMADVETCVVVVDLKMQCGIARQFVMLPSLHLLSGARSHQRFDHPAS